MPHTNVNEHFDYEPGPPELAPGTVLEERYRIDRTLGSGGMGCVYEATHLLIEKKVAIKCLHREFLRDAQVVGRFRREARAATAIGNEHIVDVIDMGDLPDGTPYIVMELLIGESLGTRLLRDPLTIGACARVGVQIADALAAAHDQGIVHRDLKPDNVFMVRRRDHQIFVKVLDFGISKMHDDGRNSSLTRTGMAIGTPTYMSPEQAKGLKSVDHRTDIYALGVLLYEMLSGHLPFVADSYPMLLLRIVSEESVPVSSYRQGIPGELNDLVMQCLAKDAAARPATMREIEAALRAFIEIEDEVQLLSPRTDGYPIPATAIARPASDRAITKPAGGALQADTPVRSERPEDATGQLISASTRIPFDRVAPPTAEARPVSASSASSWRYALLGVALVALLGVLAAGYSLSLGTPTDDEFASSEMPETASSEDGRTRQAPVRSLPETNGGSSVIDEALDPASPTDPNVTEVRVRIAVTPSSAKIYIDDTELPNPMDARQPRSLEPARLRAVAEGYQTLEQPIVLDEDVTLVLALARSDLPRVRPTPPSAPPAPTSPTRPNDDGLYRGRESRFRDDF